MAIDYKIKNKTIHYNINKEAATKLITLHPDAKRVTEQAKFPYSPLGKEYEQQIKTTEHQGDKQI